MIKQWLVQSISFYKSHISSLLVFLFGNSCRFTPTCSEYSLTAIKKHGVIKGITLSAKRILRCNPFSKVSFDPVP